LRGQVVSDATKDHAPDKRAKDFEHKLVYSRRPRDTSAQQ
jgi:hypothetical protein